MDLVVNNGFKVIKMLDESRFKFKDKSSVSLINLVDTTLFNYAMSSYIADYLNETKTMINFEEIENKIKKLELSNTTIEQQQQIREQIISFASLKQQLNTLINNYVTYSNGICDVKRQNVDVLDKRCMYILNLNPNFAYLFSKNKLIDDSTKISILCSIFQDPSLISGLNSICDSNANISSYQTQIDEKSKYVEYLEKAKANKPLLIKYLKYISLEDDLEEKRDMYRRKLYSLSPLSKKNEKDELLKKIKDINEKLKLLPNKAEVLYYTEEELKKIGLFSVAEKFTNDEGNSLEHQIAKLIKLKINKNHFYVDDEIKTAKEEINILQGKIDNIKNNNFNVNKKILEFYNQYNIGSMYSEDLKKIKELLETKSDPSPQLLINVVEILGYIFYLNKNSLSIILKDREEFNNEYNKNILKLSSLNNQANIIEDKINEIINKDRIHS